MKQDVAFTAKSDLEMAVSDLCSQMKNDYRLVLFFASSDYDFDKVSAKIAKAYPNSLTIGSTTSGEISKKGFTKGSIVMTGMIASTYEVKMSGVLMDKVSVLPELPMYYKKQLLGAMQKCGIAPNDDNSHRDAFAMTFINGLCNAEESVLATLYATVGNKNFQVIGGSAGDDLKFKETKVSLNGKVTTTGGVVLFVKSAKPFAIVKENIFKPSGRSLKLTKVNTIERKIYEINNESAASAYAKEVGCNKNDIMDVSLSHPIGRNFGSQIFISSIAGVGSDDSFSMYCRVLPNTTVELLELDDVHSIMDSTVDEIERRIPEPGFIFFINCILRTLQFENTSDGKYLTDLYQKKFGCVCGYSSYGEQIGRVNSNQTLVVLAMEE